MKIFNITTFILFIIFAALQYNDPDPYVWMPIYLYAANISLLAFLSKASNYLLIISLILFGSGFCYYIPSIVDWIMQGMPSITGTMKAHTPFIELVREALGLLICFGVIFFIYIQKRTALKLSVDQRSLDKK